MTFAEALESGYKPADMQYTKGYVSRRSDLAKQPVHVAGGSRKGELYILIPSFKSTRYCLRWYLRKD